MIQLMILDSSGQLHYVMSELEQYNLDRPLARHMVIERIQDAIRYMHEAGIIEAPYTYSNPAQETQLD